MRNINIIEINQICIDLMEKYRVYRVITNKNDKILILNDMDNLMAKYEELLKK